ncbi:ankyrin repeat-containing protein ITN1-like [Cornus florida]|uniref:ankyrin repeat-containing protein ITN1-like n=1 Tax=Cornus florida TaxID=4283 RepID=UPI00289DC81E|nr:ankyrin repeat-containing protein ITN1-like [Cornus florida]
MKEENEKAYKLLGFMCYPKWTFDSKYVGVYFEAIKRAIKCGNVEFVEEVLRSNPALLWGNKESGTIFHIALAFRQEKIWNLIYGLSVEQRNKIIGILVGSNNMLHIAAFPIITAKTKGVPDEASKMLYQGEQQFWKEFNKAPGAAMKVQRELQWYKEVEGMVPSSYRIRPNDNGETPHALFTTWYSKLVKEGEQWMRDTATSCTIVATLIVTVMFAAAFTLPGGNYNESENSRNSKSAHAGNPRFLWHNPFMIFVISDALSLFSSITTVLMLLGNKRRRRGQRTAAQEVTGEAVRTRWVWHKELRESITAYTFDNTGMSDLLSSFADVKRSAMKRSSGEDSAVMVHLRRPGLCRLYFYSSRDTWDMLVIWNADEDNGCLPSVSLVNDT